MIKKYSKLQKKGFSLVEVLISLGIINILVVIFFNALLISLTVTIKNTVRSNVREELSKVASLISKDIRAADSLISSDCSSSSCTITLNSNEIRWFKCDDQICKENSKKQIMHKSDPNIVISNLIFDHGFIDESSSLKNNVLVTIVGGHDNESLNIKNVIRQFSTSTRNYEL